MITDLGKHYLYRHIRLDTNQPFYIGIGTKENYTKNKNKRNYNRAYTKRGRNLFWNRIINKVGYDVEILLESDNYEFIKQKEIEFIKLYGRKDLKQGILCNLTDGGDGQLGVICKKETRQLISFINKGKTLSLETRQKLSDTHKGKVAWTKLDELPQHATKVYQYDNKGVLIKEWHSPPVIEKALNIKLSAISMCLKGHHNSSNGFFWSYKKLTKKEAHEKCKKILPLKNKFLDGKAFIKITHIKSGEVKFIKNRADALEVFPKSGTSSLYKYLRGELKSVEGFTCELVKEIQYTNHA